MTRLDNGGVPCHVSAEQLTAEAHRLVEHLALWPGDMEVTCGRLLDAQVKQAFILTDDVELALTLDSEQTLITVQCPFTGEVDVTWRYRSTLAHPDEDQVGDWTCPICGESQEVVR